MYPKLNSAFHNLETSFSLSLSRSLRKVDWLHCMHYGVLYCSIIQYSSKKMGSNPHKELAWNFCTLLDLSKTNFMKMWWKLTSWNIILNWTILNWSSLNILTKYANQLFLFLPQWVKVTLMCSLINRIVLYLLKRHLLRGLLTSWRSTKSHHILDQIRKAIKSYLLISSLR